MWGALWKTVFQVTSTYTNVYAVPGVTEQRGSETKLSPSSLHQRKAYRGSKEKYWGVHHRVVVCKWDRGTWTWTVGVQCPYACLSTTSACPVDVAMARSRAGLWARGFSRWEAPGANTHVHFPKDTGQVHLASRYNLPISPTSNYDLSASLRQGTHGARMSVHPWMDDLSLVNTDCLLGPSSLLIHL